MARPQSTNKKRLLQAVPAHESPHAICVTGIPDLVGSDIENFLYQR